MADYKVIIEKIQVKNKDLIEKRLGKIAKQADEEKAKVIKSVENVKELTTKIQGYMQKFDKLKDSMSQNGEKFESYQSEVENKRGII